MPKAPAFPEDEKTTLESGWEEESSTTVEQGEVAEKVRALQNEAARRNGMTNITSTGNSVLEEHTVDDQRAHAAIAAIAPPSLAVARLVVTQGNDLGQHLEIAPGKSYTIGRAIDNDFVLTDIAVSRKHFDLREDGTSWLVADRGSGNGTLVNGNLEDQPFVLANGDQIEIGNTTFRFEQANAPPRAARPAPRPAPVAGRYDIAPDEEEPSTVAGKPIRSDEIATPAQVVPPRLRPKTAPPPAPLPRARNGAPATAPPPYAAGSRPMAPPPAPTGLPGMPPRSPLQPPLAAQPMQQMLQSQQPGMRPPPSLPMQLQPPPAALPMQQMLQPQQPGMRPPPSQLMPMPQPASTLPMQQMQQMSRGPLGAQAPAMLGGDPMAARQPSLPTTIPGQGPPPAPSHPHLQYSYPSVGDMQKHGQMLVVGNGPPRDATSTALVQPTPFGMMPSVSAPTYAAPTLSRKTKLLLAGAGLTLLAAVATIAIMKGAESNGAGEASDGSGSDATQDDTDEPQSLTAPEPGKPDPDEPDSGKSGPARITKPEPTKPEPTKPEPTEDPPKIAKPEPEPTRPEPTEDPPKIAKPEPEPTRPEPTRTPPRPQPTRTPPRPQPTRTPPRPQVAAAKSDTSAVRSRASELYRQRKFSDAANALSQHAATLSGSEASALRAQASIYQQLGVAYNRGMSPGAKPADAYNELRRAQNFDGSSGGEHSTEIKAKLGQVAPKAALSFLIRKDYAQASQAVRTAEGNGISNADTKLVRDKLEQAAKELYDQAAKEMSSSPDAAKQKLRQIRGMVDSKSPTLAKANQLLSGG